MSEPNLDRCMEAPASAEMDCAEHLPLDAAKEKTSWLAVVVGQDGDETVIWKDELVPKLRQGLLDGSFNAGSVLKIHSKAEDGAWSQVEGTVADQIKQHFGLRVLYEPVWTHAKEGLKWGAIAGAGLKLLDTTVTLASVDPFTVFLFIGAIAVCAIPRLGSMAAAAVWFILFKYSKMNLFVVILAAAAVGAALGCLPGMAIGALTGFVKRRSMILARDARPELDRLVLTAVALPLTCGIALIVIYVAVLNPWIASVLSR